MAASPDPGDSLVPEEEELQNAICLLTSTEKEIINDVIHRDDEVRSQEKERLRLVSGLTWWVVGHCLMVFLNHPVLGYTPKDS